MRDRWRKNEVKKCKSRTRTKAPGLLYFRPKQQTLKYTNACILRLFLKKYKFGYIGLWHSWTELNIWAIERAGGRARASEREAARRVTLASDYLIDPSLSPPPPSSSFLSLLLIRSKPGQWRRLRTENVGSRCGEETLLMLYVRTSAILIARYVGWVGLAGILFRLRASCALHPVRVATDTNLLGQEKWLIKYRYQQIIPDSVLGRRP